MQKQTVTLTNEKMRYRNVKLTRSRRTLFRLQAARTSVVIFFRSPIAMRRLRLRRFRSLLQQQNKKLVYCQEIA